MKNCKRYLKKTNACKDAQEIENLKLTEMDISHFVGCSLRTVKKRHNENGMESYRLEGASIGGLPSKYNAFQIMMYKRHLTKYMKIFKLIKLAITKI